MPDIAKLPCGCYIGQGQDQPIVSCKKHTIEEFTHIFAQDNYRQQSSYLGVRVLKFPTDLWVLQELLYMVKPDVIVETGTAYGGGTLWMAHVLDAIGKGRIITIECDPQKDYPVHPRIIYLTGISTDENIFSLVKQLIGENESVLVNLDSAHNMKNVLKEMRMYAPLVTVGSYLIVEDTFISGHPVHFLDNSGKEVTPGPMEAVDTFLKQNNGDFVINKSIEKYIITTNPNGYLLRVKKGSPNA